MKNSEAKKFFTEAKELVSCLRDASNSYYNESESLITDADDEEI